MSSASRPPVRQPWPLWPIAVAIVVCLAGYTYVRLSFAKAARPHEPFAEGRQRALTEKLKANGWEQLETRFETTATPAAGPRIATALPVRPQPVERLFHLSTENWHLPIEYTALAATPAQSAATEHIVHFSATLDQARVRLVGFDLFRHGADLVALPRWEPHAPGTATPAAVSGRITIPAAALPTGRHTLSLPALKATAQCEIGGGAVPAN